MKYILTLFLVFLCAVAQEQSTAQPATEAEMIEDIAWYVELFASQNVLVCQHALDYIDYFGTKAVKSLQAGLKHKNAQVRAFSAIALARIPAKCVIQDLISLLTDEDTIEYNVLSDDGTRVHPAHDMPLGKYIAISALNTLIYITHKNFGGYIGSKQEQIELQQRWQEWWDKEKDSWQLPKQDMFSYQIINKKHYDIPCYAQFLQGRTICLDPGHGGDGQIQGYKRSASGNREAESNLRVARYLRDFLVQCGATVLMTRDSDKEISLADRAYIAINNNADLFLSIHHNWSFNYNANASTFWYHLSPDISPSSVDFGRYLFQEFTSYVHLQELDQLCGLRSDALIFETGFGVLRHSSPHMPAILGELSYFANLENELLLKNKHFLQDEAYGLFLGIARYFFTGIPDYEVVECTPQKIVCKLNNGLNDRIVGAFSDSITNISVRHIIAEIDNNIVSSQYDRTTGLLTIPIDQLKGKHTLQLYFYNQNKNHNRPHIHTFNIE